MSGLVDELINLASMPDVSVADLLRKAKVVAVKLKQKETAAWIDAELSGTFTDDAPHRKVPVKLMQSNPYHGMLPLNFDNVQISEIVNAPRPLFQSVGELEALARADSEHCYVQIPRSIVQTLVDMGAPTYELSHMFSRGAVVGILSAIKTKVLDWALALDESGVRGEGMTFSSDEKLAAQNVTIHFNGSHNNVAGVLGVQTGGVGASDLLQTVNTYEARAHSIADKLREGVSANPAGAAFLNETATDIETAAKTSEPGRLQRALESAKNALPMLASWATRVAAEHELDSFLNLLSGG